jgi:hypothetical protein
MKKQVIIEVSLSGAKHYMTKEAYAEFRLQLSTGDFHTHKTRELKRLPKGVSSWQVRDAVYYNPRLKYPTVESIIKAYQAEDQFAEDYTKSEESPLAEFVSSFFYGDADLTQILDTCRFEAETVDLLKAYDKKHSLKDLHDLLASVSELQRETIYYQDGEILSATIGEQEHQVDDTLAEAYQTLSAEDKERVMQESGAGIFSLSRNDGRFIYTSDNYHRWIMLADEEALVKKLKRALKLSAKPKHLKAV